MRPTRVTFVVFLIGLLVGTALGWWGKRYVRRGWHGEGRHARMLDHFSRKLDLTDDQRRKVGEIFDAKRQKMDELRKTMHPRFEELRASTKEEIAKALTPEQVEKFKEIEARWEQRRMKWRGRHGDSPH